MGNKPKLEKRAVQKALYDALHTHRPLGDPKERAKTEARLLKQANEHIAERKAQADKKVADYSWEAASYVRNRARGAVSVIGGIGNGYKLGAGRWRFQLGKGWVKIGG